MYECSLIHTESEVSESNAMSRPNLELLVNIKIITIEWPSLTNTSELDASVDAQQRQNVNRFVCELIMWMNKKDKKVLNLLYKVNSANLVLGLQVV